MAPECINTNTPRSVPVAVDGHGQIVRPALTVANINPSSITTITALELLPPPMELPADAKFRMEGVVSLKGGYWQFSGDWWRSDVDSQRASPFCWNGSRQSDGTSIT